MMNLQFPSEVYCGMDSLEKIFNNDYSGVLIISDGNIAHKTGTLAKLKNDFESLMTKTQLIISDDAQTLFQKANRYADLATPDIIIAIGDGKTLDCAAALSKLTGIPFAAIPEASPTALFEYNTLDVFLYKKFPKMCILNPDFILMSDSMKIAYEGFGIDKGEFVSACEVISQEDRDLYYQCYYGRFNFVKKEIDKMAMLS